MEWEIRPSRATETVAVADLVRTAFGGDLGREVGDLVPLLLEDPTAEPRLSLVAVDHGALVGQVLFTRADLQADGRLVPGAILAPLAVLTDHQRRGIGGALIAEGVRRLEAGDAALLFVLGDPDYYGRHGFRPAGAVGVEAPYPIAAQHADAWMVRPLKPGFIGRARGRVRCADALMDPRHWQE